MSLESNPLTKHTGFSEGQESFHEKQRRLLGIPQELRDKPVLYLSSHRGVFSAAYPSHVAQFKLLMNNEAATNNDEKESAYVDLSNSTSGQVVDLLRQVLLRPDASREGTMLPSQSPDNAPLPGFSTNVTFLPPLDAIGNASEPAHTFAIDQYNYKAILPSLADFLEKKGILSVPLPQIEG